MGSPYRHNMHAQHRGHLYRRRHRSAPERWHEMEPGSLPVAMMLTSIGAAFLLGFILAILNGAAISASPLLLFGCSTFLFGVVLLLLALGEQVAQRLIRTKKHCGCCAFYQPHDEEYDVGLCRADPREGYVQRTYKCPYFCFSERAMVRDRLAQRPELLKQLRMLQMDNGQANTD